MIRTLIRALAVALMASGCAGSGPSGAAAAAAGGAGGIAGPAGSSGAGGTTASPGEALPCDVAAIVQTNCAKCHAPPLNFGVPMDLLTADDFHAPAKSDASRTVASLVAERIASDAKPMPPAPNARLGANEIATLTTWLQAGAPAAGATGCGVTPAVAPTTSPTSTGAPPTTSPTGTVPPPSTSPTAMPAPTGTVPPTPTTTATVDPPPANPGETMTCYDFTSHGQSAAGDKTPFQIPAGESYHCFYFDVPWSANEVAAGFRSKLDNTKGLHHWFLYAMPTTHPNGTSENCLPLHFDGPELIAGWSPGAHDINMPSDVGAEIPKPMTTVMVEWHYLNSTGAPLADSSSVSVCTVPSGSRPKLASIAWVGQENISIAPLTQGTATGVCKPGRKGMGASDPIQLLYAAPHMHQYGRHFSIEIDHADGSNTMAMDQTFDVGNQAMVETPFKLLPGDTLKTTCTFQNTSSATVGWGDPFTGGEMCYGFVFHYPAHALDNGTRSLLGATNSCL